MTAAKTQAQTSLGRETSAGVTRAAASSANMIDQQLQDAVEAERLIDLELEELIRTSGASVLDGMRKTLDPEGSVLSSIRSAMAGISSLSEKTTETATLAARVSSKIRSLDVRQSRVREVLSRIDTIDERKRSVEGVKRALDAGDLGAAVGCVSQFLDSLPEEVEVEVEVEEGGSADADADRKPTITTTTSSSSSRETRRENESRQQRDAMEAYRKQCEDMVRAAVDDAIAKDDMASVMTYCQMFGPLKLQKEGVRTLVGFVTKKIRANAKEAYDALVDGFSLTGAKVTYVDALTNVLKDVAEGIDATLDAMRDAFGPEYALEGVHTLHEECDVWGARVMARYTEEKGLSKLVEASLVSASPSASMARDSTAATARVEVSILMELLVICTRGEEYIKYVLQAMAEAASPNALAPAMETTVRGGPFGSSMREVLSYYISLEEVYVEESVIKAIEIDQTVPGSLTSSMVDDSFYVLLSAGKRALSTGRAPSAVAVLNQINTVLGTVYKSSLMRKLQGCPSRLAACVDGGNGGGGSGGSGGGGSGGGGSGAPRAPAHQQPSSSTSSESHAYAYAHAYAVVMNDVDLSAVYVEKLREQLEQVAHQVFSPTPQDDDRIQMVLADLNKTSSEIRRLADQATEQLTTSLMLKTRHTLEAFISASYELSDAGGGFEISDQWSALMLQSFGRTFSWLRPMLTPDLMQRVLASAVDKIVSRMEAAVAAKTFTQLGGLQLDKDVRALVIGLSELCETSLRDKFARLGQLATVLSVESAGEAADLIRDELLSLSALDVRSALMQRVDLSQSAVLSLQV